MASDEGIKAQGLDLGAEDALSGRPEGNEEESEEESETEADDDSEEDSEEESETETDDDSEEDSESEEESDESESEAESETETEATSTETERTTAVGDDKPPRQQLPPAEDDASSLTAGRCPRPQQLPPAEDNPELLTPPSADDDGIESLASTQPDNDPQPLHAPPEEDEPVAPATWSLPPAPSRNASREGASPHQTPRAEEARASGTAEATQDGQPETASTLWSLPPAVSRNSSRDCSRLSSHREASTSGSALRQSSSSLPPINVRNTTQQPSRKGSSSSSQAAARSSQASSPKQGSPPRYTAPRYYQPPPPPPPPPKPKPRERHDVSAVDPVFLQTAVYRTVPNVGRVYDWKLQHEVNAALSKQRKQQAQMDKVLEAARVQLQVREANERAFQQWMASKEQEKQQQSQHNRRIAYVTSVYRSLLKEDPVECKAREALWVSNFAYSSSGGTPPGALTRERGSEDAERFRL